MNFRYNTSSADIHGSFRTWCFLGALYGKGTLRTGIIVIQKALRGAEVKNLTNIFNELCGP